jgi:2-C-methyl-D-erythritol 2,4-cyclodiphosphate synthase
MDYRTGIGYDIHRLVEERKLILGGIEIPYIKGLLGHSDGDALIHAVCDAILGALNKGDMGEHFPDTDPKFQGISSTQFLLKVKEMLKEAGFEIVNIDTVIIVQQPRITPFKEQIKKRLSEILDLEPERINIKAKTNEGLGEIGKKEAIACWVVVLIKRKG